MVSKAESISRPVLALTTWICSPMARAAAVASLTVVSVLAPSAGLTSTAMRAARGTSSRIQPLCQELGIKKIDTGQHHRDLSANQIGRQLWQSIDLILGETVQDCHVLALDIAGVFETLAKSTQAIRNDVRRSTVEETNHRYRR